MWPGAFTNRPAEVSQAANSQSRSNRDCWSIAKRSASRAIAWAVLKYPAEKYKGKFQV